MDLPTQGWQSQKNKTCDIVVYANPEPDVIAPVLTKPMETPRADNGMCARKEEQQRPKSQGAG